MRVSEIDDALDVFFVEGWITEVLREIKSGKEATVYCCKAGERAGVELLAAKFYRPREQRGFKNHALYMEDKKVGKARENRAFANHTRFGHDAAFAAWVYFEFDVLTRMAKIGAITPRPFRASQQAVLMDFIGDLSGPAPHLNSVRLEPAQAERVFELLIGQVELWLGNNIIHGDLSPYNILYWNERPVVIDLPQAVDPRAHKSAFQLLYRDIENLCRYFERQEVMADPMEIADDLWTSFQYAELLGR